MNSLRKKFQQLIHQYKWNISEQQLNLLLNYIHILAKWNNVYNLTAVKDISLMLPKHLLDSISILPYIPQKTHNILDVGSGAGLPGIPLAIIQPNVQYTLIDSNGKKTGFMQYCINTLEINNIKIVNSRVESWTPNSLFSIIISRAFASLTNMITQTQHLLTNQGQWLAMKGCYPTNEIQTIQQSNINVKIQNIIKLHVPELSEERHLIVLKKC